MGKQYFGRCLIRGMLMHWRPKTGIMGFTKSGDPFVGNVTAHHNARPQCFLYRWARLLIPPSLSPLKHTKDSMFLLGTVVMVCLGPLHGEQYNCLHAIETR